MLQFALYSPCFHRILFVLRRLQQNPPETTFAVNPSEASCFERIFPIKPPIERVPGKGRK